MASNNKKLLAAAKRGDINAVNELLSTTKNVNINVKDKFGNTPMMIAVQNSDSPMTHVLMSYHANVNQATITKLNKNKSVFFRKRLIPTLKKYMKMTNKMTKKTRKHRR
jgi:ankyrin repeat protein